MEGLKRQSLLDQEYRLAAAGKVPPGPHIAYQYRLIPVHGGMDSFPLPLPALSNLASTG